MARLLLDTTVLIDAERSTDELEALIAADDDVAIAAITVAELSVGVGLATGRRRDARAAFLDDVLATIPVLVYDVVVAEAHAQLLAAVRRAGKPRGAHDLIIAGTALATGRTFVTVDASAFTDLPGVTAVSTR